MHLLYTSSLIHLHDYYMHLLCAFANFMFCGIVTIPCFVLCQTLSSFISLCYVILVWNILFCSSWIFSVIIVCSLLNCDWFCAYLFFTLVNFCISSFMEVVVFNIFHCSFCFWFCCKTYFTLFLCFLLFTFPVSHTYHCPILLQLLLHLFCAYVSTSSISK